MIVSVVPMGTISASAISESEVKSKLDSFISSHPSGSRWTGTFDGGSQCYGFGKLVIYNIFGKNSSGGYRGWNYAGVSTSGMKTIGSVTSFSASNVQSLLSKAKCGDVLQFDQTKQHTMIVYSVDSTGVTIYDCNWDNNCGISKRHSSFGAWSGRNSAKLTLLRADNYETVHVHSYSGSSYEGDHPHRVYQTCSCGATKYTGETVAYQNCSTCMKVSWNYVYPMQAYTIQTGKTTVYTSVDGRTAKSNKIYDTDLCTINEIYDCGWCKVTFPLDAGGTETGYCKASVFMTDGGFCTYASKQIKTYRRSNLKTSSGYVASGDKIRIFGSTSSTTQVVYPIASGGWKVGWIPTSELKSIISYNANGGSGSMANTSATYNSTFKLSANQFIKTGYTFSGWNVYRNSDKKWYVAGQGWFTANEISNKNYTKKVYSDNSGHTLDYSWILDGKTNETFTFYAVWTPNKLNVSYNANGGTITSDTYKLSNNIIYTTSNNTKFAQVWTYNEKQTNGLYNAKTFGLTREGYTFKGWGTTASGGTVFDQDDSTLVPTSINSSIKNGNCTTTLYAIWEKIPATVSSISIQSKPTKTTYMIGDTFSSSGLSIKVNMSDGTSKTVTSGFTLSSPDMSTAGTKTVTVTYQGKTTSFTVTVQTPSISVSANSKTMTVGDTVTLTATTTPSGQTVIWTSSNTSVVSVSNGVVTAKASGTAIITAKFTYNGRAYSKTCNVTVNNPPATVSSIAVQSKPTKTVYTVGEAFSSSGLSIKVNMSDGTSKTVTSGFTVSAPNMSTVGTKTVTVTYSGKSTTFTITVNPLATVSSIAVQSKPTKTVYTVGETFNLTGLSIKVNISDGTSKTVTSGFTVSSPNMSTAGTKTVTVTYQGKTTSFTITVNPVSTNNPSIKIDAGKAVCGQQINIPVIVEKTDLGTLTIDITYDSTKLQIASIGEIPFDMYDTNTKTAGKIRITATGNSSVPAGKVAVLTFDVTATSACKADITITVDEAYDANDNAVNLTVFNGVLEILKAVPGDINGDGKVSAIDARIALQYNAGNKELTAEQLAAADVNGDGKVSAIDARWILQAVAGNRTL